MTCRRTSRCSRRCWRPSGATSARRPTAPRRWTLLADEIPDVLLLDLMLPGMDGFEVARRVRRRLGEGSPRLVATSASAMEHEQQASIDAGFDEFLPKPIDCGRLYATLARLLGVEFRCAAAPAAAPAGPPQMVGLGAELRARAALGGADVPRHGPQALHGGHRPGGDGARPRVAIPPPVHTALRHGRYHPRPGDMTQDDTPSAPQVLIVDDNPANLDVLGQLLEAHGLPRAGRAGRRGGPAAGGRRPAGPDPARRDDARAGRVRDVPPAQGRPRDGDVPVIFISAGEETQSLVRGVRGRRRRLHHQAVPRRRRCSARVGTHLQISQLVASSAARTRNSNAAGRAGGRQRRAAQPRCDKREQAEDALSVGRTAALRAVGPRGRAMGD